MYSVIKTAAVHGIQSMIIQVEADVCDGMPVFEMVGILASEVKDITTTSLIQSNDTKVPVYRLCSPKTRGFSCFQSFKSQTKAKVYVQPCTSF